MEERDPRRRTSRCVLDLLGWLGLGVRAMCQTARAPSASLSALPAVAFKAPRLPTLRVRDGPRQEKARQSSTVEWSGALPQFLITAVARYQPNGVLHGIRSSPRPAGDRGLGARRPVRYVHRLHGFHFLVPFFGKPFSEIVRLCCGGERRRVVRVPRGPAGRLAAEDAGLRVRRRRGLQPHPAERRVLRPGHRQGALLLRRQQLLPAQQPEPAGLRPRRHRHARDQRPK
jgi:hypothetical protein